MINEFQEIERKEVTLKSFLDEKGQKVSLKNARNLLKEKKSSRITCMASCDGKEIITGIVQKFISLTKFVTDDGLVYEIVDSENTPIKVDVVRFVNSETEQETFHEAIAQKWLQQKDHVTAVVVTNNGDAYRTSCIVNVNWHEQLFLTSSGRRYLFSDQCL